LGALTCCHLAAIALKSQGREEEGYGELKETKASISGKLLLQMFVNYY